MEQQRFRCRHCGKLKVRRALEQTYCGEKACQQARRNAWRREKYSEDSDYRLNQRASTAAWLSSQGGARAYYRRYRSRRKASTPSAERGSGNAEGGLRPPLLRSVGEKARRVPCITSVDANRDASFGDLPLKSGRYTLCPAGANRDAVLVEIRVVPDG